MIQMVRRFHNDGSIRRKQFDFEDTFKAIFPSPAIVPPLPIDPPPSAVRFLFNDPKKNLAVTGSGVQLTLNFLEGFPTGNTIKTIVTKYAKIMDDALDTLLDNQDKHHSGIIVFYTKKYEGADADVASGIADMLLKPTISNLCSLSINIGFIEEEVTHTIEVSGYKSFNVLVPLGAFGSTQNVEVDADFDTPVESGLQIKIDINTKLQANSNRKGAFTFLTPYLISTIKDKASRLLGDLRPTKGV